jgi:Tfp pilus assembly protein PilO
MLLVSLLVVGASGLVVKSLFTTIKRDKKVLDAKSKADKQLKEDVDAAPQLVSAYDSLGPERVILGDALPTTVDFPSLIVALENMSGAAGVKLKTVAKAQLANSLVASGSGAATAAPTASDGGVPAPQAYDFSVAISGTYEAMKKFLGSVETSARPMHVLDMQLSGSGSSMSADVNIETYYQDKAQLPLSKETIR